MKIGILTFWWSEDNYGQLLQCYALQKYLRDLGHDAYLIRYDRRKDYNSTPLILKLLKALNPSKLAQFLKYIYRQKVFSIEHDRNPRYFEEFRNTYINQSDIIYTSYEELKTNPPQADAYIVGSDQIWNFSNVSLKKAKNLVHAYFLDFGTPETKRLSYAASWSMSSIPTEFSKEIAPLLKKFDYVSVREEIGIELCASLNVKAEWVVDPTLLLEINIYRDLYKNCKVLKPQKPYLFLYLLGNEGKHKTKDFFEWGQSKNLEVVYITGNANIDRYPKTFASIPEWLYLLDNANYVITNSFHCSVFSILFEKQFAVVPTSGIDKRMNSRLDSLWKLLEIKPRILNGKNFEILEENYKPILSNQINTFLQYLKE